MSSVCVVHPHSVNPVMLKRQHLCLRVAVMVYGCFVCSLQKASGQSVNMCIDLHSDYYSGPL